MERYRLQHLMSRKIHNMFASIPEIQRRKLSFVDCVSFMAMRHYKVEKVFGFDRHFVEQGFEIVSEG